MIYLAIYLVMHLVMHKKQSSINKHSKHRINIKTVMQILIIYNISILFSIFSIDIP